MPRLSAILLLLLLAVPAVAGELNPVLSIGDKGPAWEKLPGVDGKQHSFTDLKEKEVLVVFFTCNSCEYAQDYEDRIVAISSKYAGKESKVGFVGINVNLIEADSLPKMKEKAEAKKFPFPYLFDETQKIAKDYGASSTPEFFVLDKDRKVVYMGSLDDNADAKKAKVNYLQLAIDAALEGKLPEKKETPPLGCFIRWKRMRK
jgi:peroxiredoxin